MIAVISDVDGSMIDEKGRDEGVKESLELLSSLGIKVALATTKTAAETKELWRRVGAGELLAAVELGGALCSSSPLPYSDFEEGGLECLLLGSPIAEFEEEMERALEGCSYVRLSKATPAQASEILGFPEELAALAVRRQLVEVIWSRDLSCLLSRVGELEKRGLRAIAGYRFLHVGRHEGKGRAMELMKALLRARKYIAIGDSPLDRDMLEMADVAIVIPRDGMIDVRPRRADYIVAPYPAPQGWVWASRQIALSLI
ncbi:MAG: hypothetical protein NZ902_00520 [Acidilobaceae archaeon]|nr:hypothetical protein [Acidilobaceae archaeon]MCX8165318.1 hypothetical protein [Acidilobaceae archaeon]MDW7973744.1 hypothetical protein [Sulfolobales archaeon]